jgi:protoporphyrinogen oxidase
MAVTAEITTNSGDGIHELDDDQIYRRVIDGLEAMELLHRRDVRFRRIHRTRHAYVVRTFDYQERLTKALEYISSLGIVSVGRNAEFEYINMDEAIRRGMAIAHSLDLEVAEQASTATR